MDVFRLVTLVSLVGTMAISVFYRRRARIEGETIERRREHSLLVTGRAIVGIPLFTSVILYIAKPDLMTWSTLAIPNLLRWLGALLGIASIPMAHWVFSSLGQNVSETILTKKNHMLVTSGPYRWIRHPLYSTGLMLFAGISLMNASWFMFGLSVATLVGITTVIIPREEAQLIARFGDEYRHLIQRTGKLLPRIRS